MTETKNQQKGFQTGNVLLIGFSHFLHDIYTSFLAPLLPLLIRKFELSYSLSSLFYLFQNLPTLFNPFIGAMADKVKMRYLVIFAPAVTATAMSLIGVAPHYILLIILVIIAGTSSAFFHVPTPVMMRKVSGNAVGRGMSFYMLGGEIARTVGPMVILGAVSLWGLEGSYKLIPFGLLASGFLYFRFKNVQISNEISKEANPIGIKKTLRKYMPFFILISGYLFSRAIMKSALTAYLPTFMNFERDQSLWFSGAALSILQLAAAVGTFFSGTLSDRIGRKTTLLVIALVSPVFMWFFVSSQNEVLMFVFLILIGLFHFATGPVLLAMVQDLNADRPAFVNSIYMTISFLISSVAVILSGVLSDWLGLESMYKLTAFIALGGIPFVILLRNTKK